MSIDINKLRQLAQGANEHSDDRAEILAEFYAATQSDTIIELLDRLEDAEKERDALRAKVEQMEKQEPVARFNWSKGKLEWLLPWNYRTMDMKPLYLAPGAKGKEI